MTTNLHRVRWAVRATLTIGVAASVAANILHARPNPISQAISAWPPLALLATVELISRVPVSSRLLSATRIAATAAIAGIAAWVSYWHMASVVARYGETGASPYLMPFSVDGLIVVASICLVELAARIRATTDTTIPRSTTAPTRVADDHRPGDHHPNLPTADPAGHPAAVVATPLDVPTHLIPTARFAATNHQVTTGHPITAAELAGRISVTEPVATALLATLNPTAPTATTPAGPIPVNGTPIEAVTR